MSHQLRLLRPSRVVERRKGGRIVYYRLADEHIRHVLADGLRHSAEEQALGWRPRVDIEHSTFQLEPSDRRPIEENATGERHVSPSQHGTGA